MRLFAPNEVVAKSRFWYFLKQFSKVKKASGEVVSCSQVGRKERMVAWMDCKFSPIAALDICAVTGMKNFSRNSASSIETVRRVHFSPSYTRIILPCSHHYSSNSTILFIVCDRFLKRSQAKSRTLVSGSVTTADPVPTTCTKSTASLLVQMPSFHATRTLPPSTVLVSTLSTSSRLLKSPMPMFVAHTLNSFLLLVSSFLCLIVSSRQQRKTRLSLLESVQTPFKEKVSILRLLF